MEDAPQVTATQDDERYTLSVGGCWRMGDSLPAESEEILARVKDSRVRVLRLEADALGTWDTSLLVFLVRAVKQAHAQSVSVQDDHLPEGVRRLLHLAFAVPPKDGSQRSHEDLSFFASVGEAALTIPTSLHRALEFLGDITLSVGRLFSGRADIRSQDVFSAMHECGLQALPIISLTSMLFGLILAFVGAVQLTQFGAQVYVAGLVGIGMLRVMGAIMVGVVMAGRMGASYAALIGSMQVNEEVDALSTFGISPIDFLVLPRVLALTAMVPLLTLYADFMGMLGGFLVGVFMLGLHPLEYWNATVQMVPFKHVLIGLVYSTVFGVIIALSGCYQGIHCGRSAAAVGVATTAAVVNAIVGIIVATAIITVIFNVLNI